MRLAGHLTVGHGDVSVSRDVWMRPSQFAEPHAWIPHAVDPIAGVRERCAPAVTSATMRRRPSTAP